MATMIPLPCGTHTVARPEDPHRAGARYGRAVSGPARTVTRSVDVAAPPHRVWDLVSDLPAMGRFSPENEGGRWQGGATGPAVGAVFRGANRSGRRRWSTRCTVTRCEPGRSFAFAVSAVGRPVAEWSYELAPTDTGCTVTETWHDRRGPLVTWLGRLTTGVQDRSEFTATSIEHTLARVKAHTEQD